MRKRSILPIAYCEKKIKRGEMNSRDHIIASDVPIVDESKLQIQLQIQHKMNAMNGIFIELDDEEVAAVQEVIDIEEDTNESEIIFNLLDTPFPVPFNSKIEFDESKEMESDTTDAIENSSTDNTMPDMNENVVEFGNNVSVGPIRLDLWQQMVPIDVFEKSITKPIVDNNNIASYLHVMQYYFEGKCVIVSRTE